MATIGHGNDTVRLSAECVAVGRDGLNCMRTPLPDAPVPLCGRHLRGIYEYAAGLIDATWRDRLREVTCEMVTPPTIRRSWVYFIRKGDRIKIGVTTSPAKRFQTLKPDVVLHLEPGTVDDERNLHATFVDYWLGNEWFSDVPAIREHIEARRAARRVA